MGKKKARAKWESYFREYEKFLKEVRQEILDSYPKESDSLLAPIADSIEFYSREEKEWQQTPHSLVLILKNYLWKLTNWISYEILHGKYFEAMRDTRFLFEGSIWGMILEDAIEKVIYQKEKVLSKINLKLEIMELWETAKQKKIYKIKELEKRKEKAKKIVKEYFQQLAKQKRLRSISNLEKEKYIENYSLILADERLGFSIRALIDKEIRSFLEPLNEKEKEKFKKVWVSLCKYAHFPGNFFHKLVNEAPQLIFVEAFNKNLFQECVNNYLITLDLFYSVALWRWPSEKAIKRLKEIDNFWRKNLNHIYNRYFTLFPKMIKLYEKNCK